MCPAGFLSFFAVILIINNGLVYIFLNKILGFQGCREMYIHGIIGYVFRRCIKKIFSMHQKLIFYSPEVFFRYTVNFRVVNAIIFI